MKQVMLIGDSIRMGYQDEVKKYLEDILDVWSPEENCADSKFHLENLDKWLSGKNPEVIYLNCGHHDIARNDQSICRRTPAAYSENLELIFTKIKNLCHNAKIIFVLSTPVDSVKQKVSPTYLRVIRTDADVVRYNLTAAAIAQKHNIMLDDLYKVLKESWKDIICSDGCHLSEQGKEIAGKHIAQTILRETDSKNPLPGTFLNP